MNVSPLGIATASLACNVPAQRCPVGSGQLITACRLAWEQGGQLVALWGSDERDQERGFCLRVLLKDSDGLTLLEHTLPDEGARYPDLSAIFPAANRMQRTAFDLVGVQCDADDQRPWAWQAAWPIDQFPLRRDFVASPKWEPGQEDYPFVRVAGDGVHEIAVGPVHAGIIEPGHFRFQVVGEKVLRLEERLSYVHKGIEKRFETLPVTEGYRLAGRVSGDSTVAYAWAYAQAVEAIAAIAAPARAVWMRALCLERERVANHLGDLGYLGNDGGFAFGLAQFSRLKEDVLRLNAKAFGHRLLMDVVVPGGIAYDLDAGAAAGLRAQCTSLAREIRVLRDIYDEHAGLQDRFRQCGEVTRELAAKLGLTGFAARASALAEDLRCDFPMPPYDALAVRKVTKTSGDVAARVAMRFDETFESLRLIEALLDAMPTGEIAAPLPALPAFGFALGVVEAWRGPVVIALESGPDGTIRRCHPHDPSWQNWPVLEHAVIGNIVPDFPLINKSFNLSYSGHDL
ncbi:MAG TPA: NADH-quinone oxidoreductase subunit C [Casimicrobiaceae bacterium]|jgi:Ni,Fe-hydrogenase III large subunit/Ni,Fe-hydrogenase III component G|nr:NADH-quinone oxidoreductase subunit C [Casimicrobiaceae bacterium]